MLESGDLVFMCGKANGKDWDARKGWTLRHATGVAHAAPDAESVVLRLC